MAKKPTPVAAPATNGNGNGAPTRSVKMQGTVFTVKDVWTIVDGKLHFRGEPFQGDATSVAEAINQTWAENLRNNISGDIIEAKMKRYESQGHERPAKPGANATDEDTEAYNAEMKSFKDACKDIALSADEIAAIQADLDKYALEYMFDKRAGGGRAKDPVTKQMELLIKQAIARDAAAKGITYTVKDESAKVDAILANPRLEKIWRDRAVASLAQTVDADDLAA